ncbi:Hypothetical predicted protein [Mytilus galloprovincialis]|uniref:carbonic anhydrase n=1 Tax=Mytilus galloprovincialis TaxID=29158 RepID=A0A8B6EXX7_MYTGA|nr:Hypothetical predicted protein [Mytilus galloprovincialis]
MKTSKVKTDTRLWKFDFSKLSTSKNVKFEITNNGHTVQVRVISHGLEVSGGGLPGTYNVEQFHFHWGSEDKRESKHEINGKHFSMEMHVVMHFDRFSSVNESMNITYGLAVLGFLFDLNQFRHLGRTHYNGTGDLINNFRNPQPLNRRVFTSNCRRSSTCSCGKTSKTRSGGKSRSRRGKKSNSKRGKKSKYRNSRKLKTRRGDDDDDDDR